MINLIWACIAFIIGFTTASLVVHKEDKEGPQKVTTTTCYYQEGKIIKRITVKEERK